MADNTENSGEPGSKQVTDIAFMAECFKHLQGPFNVDLPAMAESLGYKNPASVGNRLRAIKKKLGIGATDGTEGGTENGSPATTPKTPRKGAKAARGPIKVKPEVDGEEKPAGSPAKRGRKPAANGGRKRKTAETDDKENEEPIKAENVKTEAAEDEADKIAA